MECLTEVLKIWDDCAGGWNQQSSEARRGICSVHDSQSQLRSRQHWGRWNAQAPEAGAHSPTIAWIINPKYGAFSALLLSSSDKVTFATEAAHSKWVLLPLRFPAVGCCAHHQSGEFSLCAQGPSLDALLVLGICINHLVIEALQHCMTFNIPIFPPRAYFVSGQILCHETSVGAWSSDTYAQQTFTPQKLTVFFLNTE